MRLRRVDPNGDMTFGGGSANFWQDVPDGVAQAIASTLNLWAGQWFLDSTAGVQWDAKVLGNRTGSTRDMVIQTAILGVPGVLTILTYSSAINRSIRAFSVSGTVQTIFGPAAFQYPQYNPGSMFPITDDSGDAITDDGGAPITP